MWSWPLLGEASTMLPGVCAASPISTPKWGQIGPTSNSKAGRKGIRLGSIFHDSGPLRKLVDFQAKLINFGEGLGPRAPRAPPGANFPRFWRLQKSGRFPSKTRLFWGVCAPERPERLLRLIFQDSAPLRKVVDFRAKLVNFGGVWVLERP